MGSGIWHELVEQLRGSSIGSGSCVVTSHASSSRVEFETGLSDAEVTATERRFGFRFPPDLRAFLQTALPTGPRFPDWRAGDEAAILYWLDSPLRGVLSDIEYNGFWLEEWGPRPDSVAEARRQGAEPASAAPRLIPIFGHRMMPDEPHLPGNPVFSVHQTEIIYYGADLADYFRHEFHLPGREPRPKSPRPIRFWDIDRFQDAAWAHGPRSFDNSEGQLP